MKKNLQYYIPFVFLLFLCFLCLEQIKLSFEINRLNSNHQNLIIEYENFKDTNIKLLTQFHSNNSPQLLRRSQLVHQGRHSRSLWTHVLRRQVDRHQPAVEACPS